MRIVYAIVFAAAVTGCSVPSDEIEFDQLERLRVLGLRAEPPDVVVGESIELSALVFEPTGAPVRYEWSWCPRLGNGDDGFRCRVDESELRAAWNEVSELELPPFDLGSNETASFETVFDPELAIPLCQALTDDLPNADTELFLCLSELELSVVLRVRSGDSEVTSFRTLPLADPEQARNTNPTPAGEISLAEEGAEGTDPRPLSPGELLRATSTYVVTAGVTEDQGEMWQPPEEEGLPPPEARPEALFLSWFVTTGEVSEQRTNWAVPGDFEDMLENDWEMARDGGGRARLFLVLRDERGGIGWIDYDLGTVEER